MNQFFPVFYTYSAGQLFNQTIVAIWDDRGDVHSTLIPFRSIMHVSLSKDTTTM